jgi:hypothetical protein
MSRLLLCLTMGRQPLLVAVHLDLAGIDAGLGEQLFVVEEAHLDDRLWDAVDLPVERERRHRRRRQRFDVAFRAISEVFDHAGLDLCLQHAAGLAVKHGRLVAGLDLYEQSI